MSFQQPMMKRTKGKPTCCLKKFDSGLTTVFTISPSDNDVVTQYRLQKAKSEIISAQINAKANIDFITKEQQNVSSEIESLKKAINDLEFLIASSKCKTIHPKKLSDLCKVLSSLRIDLSNAQNQENRLKRQFHEARLEYRNAKLGDHMVSEDIKKFKNKSWDLHSYENRVLEQRRHERELQSKKNAVSAREETITSVANSITVHVLQKLPGEHNISQKRFREAKSARQSTTKYLSKSLRLAREAQAVAQTENQIRMRRQKHNLLKLKREINEIKKTLSVKSHLRRIHEEEIASEKEEVKHLLHAQGANPYLAEYLLAIEEKQRELQRKMLVEEQKRLLEMQREYSAIETAKAKEEAERKKWDQYWSKRALDRLMTDRKSKLELYFDLSGEEEENEQIKTQLHGKVVEQIHQRMSQNLHAFTGTVSDDENEEEEETSKPKKSQEYSAGASESIMQEVIPEEVPLQFKPQRRSVVSELSVSTKEKKSREAALSYDGGKSKAKGLEVSKPFVAEEYLPAMTPVEVSLRKAIHLEETQKESLLRMAGAGENTKAILMNGGNVFDFGNVPVGHRKYIHVNVANIGMDPVKLKMSVLNPYGPFSFCNSLKEIPQDNYFSLKFKYQPTEIDEESQETIRIEEVGKPENYIIIKFKGHAVGWLGGE